MAGHSKWANIRFRKAAQDNRRGKVFTKLIREITIAARMGGSEQDANPRLRDAVVKALKANMKRDTIDNAIKRGAGGLEGADLMELRYEGYGPNGVAVLVECLTDNKNRTVSEVRYAFSRHGGNLGTDGSVAYLFTKQGQICFQSSVDEEQIINASLDAGAEDVITHPDGAIEVLTLVESFNHIKQALEDQDLQAETAEITMVAKSIVELGMDDAEKLLRLVDSLEDLDDVQHVYFNAEISDQILEKLE